ncbi:ribonuclease H-like domain-containing protein [Tanacetum coccineum]
MVRSMWLFKHKFHADGTLSRYKARLVANDSSQQLGVDFDVTFLSKTLLQQIIGSLNNEFDMTDLGALNYFLGISADRTPTGLPLIHESKLGPEGAPVQDPTLYRNLVGAPGTLDLGLHLYASSTTSLVGYTDADWAGCPSTRSAEAEYRGVANVVAETAWLRNLLRELLILYRLAISCYCDKVRVLHVPSRFQYADIFTKGLPSALFEEFRSSLSVRPPPAPTAGAY